MVTTPKAPRVRRPAHSRWSETFLAELAATSNVAASARKARVATARVYALRRTDAEFNRRWHRALCEGYELLEMGLLQRLREGEIKPPPGAKRGVRSYDNAVALRLLGAHKELASRQRAVRTTEDSEAILQAINARLERMRQRAIAAGEIPA